MSNRCPPGVICIENATILFIVIIIIIILAYLLINKKDTTIFQMPQAPVYTPPPIQPLPDVLLNPYEPPLRDDRLFLNSGRPGGIPINIPTQGPPTVYRQVGILTRLNGPELILPLMGRPVIANRDKWNFYTMKDGNQMIKLPITNKGKSCTNDYGCDNLYNGDTVYVEGYNDAFKVTSYDNQTMHYIPYL